MNKDCCLLFSSWPSWHGESDCLANFDGPRLSGMKEEAFVDARRRTQREYAAQKTSGHRGWCTVDRPFGIHPWAVGKGWQGMHACSLWPGLIAFQPPFSDIS